MKIIVVGATGTVGAPVAAELAKRHEVVRAARKGADASVDITDPSSIKKFYEKIGRYDALVCAAGEGHFGQLGLGQVGFRAHAHDEVTFLREQQPACLHLGSR